MRDRLLILYGFLIVTIITGVTLFAATGSVYLLKGTASGEEFVEVADLYILNSLAEDTLSDTVSDPLKDEITGETGKIYYDDSFLDESEEVKTLKVKPSNDSLLEQLRKKDKKWHVRRHEIQKGDSIWKLAKKYETDYTLIIASNSLTNPDQIRPGKNLDILTKQGFSYRVKDGDTLSELALKYKISQKSIHETNAIGKHLLAGSTIFLPDATEIEEVSPAPKEVVSAMVAVSTDEKSSQSEGSSLASEAKESKFEKEQETLAALTEKEDSSLKAVVKNKQFVWPAHGEISSGFGKRVSPIYGEEMFHNGIDICVIEGTSVKAAAAGKVIFSGWKEGYGNMVVIRHENNYLTVYAHLAESKVAEHQQVKQNQEIALSGNTGLTTGAHLHFEIRKYDTPLNPVRML